MLKDFITKRYNRYIVIADNRYKIVINKYGESTLKPLVKRVYAGRIQGQKVENLSNKSDCSYSLSSCLKERKIKRLLKILL